MSSLFSSQMLLTFLKVSSFITLKPLRARFSGAGGGGGQPAGDARSAGQQRKRPGEGKGCLGLSSLPCCGRGGVEHGRISPGRGLCSKPGAGKVRPSSAPLLTHQHPAPGLLRTAATQRKQIEESSTSSRSTGIILHHQQPPPPPPHPPPILRIKHRTAAESCYL